MSRFYDQYGNFAVKAILCCLVIAGGYFLWQGSTLLAQQGESPLEWHPFFCVGNETCTVGDFDGDGNDDIIAFIGDNAAGSTWGSVWVGLSSGSTFGEAQLWHSSFCVDGQICKVADFNGDGRDDIAAYFTRDPASSDGFEEVWVSLSAGSYFEPPQHWYDLPCGAQNVCVMGDFNGDNSDEIAVIMTTETSGRLTESIQIVSATGDMFGETQISDNAACMLGETCYTGDVNGDQMHDIIRFASAESANFGSVWVTLSTGSGFEAPQMWHSDFCAQAGAVCTIGDFNKDQQVDLLRFMGQTNNGAVDVAISSGTAFQSPINLLQFFCTNNELCMVSDANGDGADDVIAFVRGNETTPNRGKVYVSLTNSTGLAIPVTPGVPNTAPATTNTQPCTPPTTWIIYVVQSGDTLFNLATNTGTTIDEVRVANCDRSVDPLIVGAQIRLPRQPTSGGVSSTAVPPTTAPAPTPIPNPTSVPQASVNVTCVMSNIPHFEVRWENFSPEGVSYTLTYIPDDPQLPRRTVGFGTLAGMSGADNVPIFDFVYTTIITVAAANPALVSFQPATYWTNGICN